jgi:DNA damage-binding protein 1
MTLELYEGVVTVVPIVQAGKKATPAELGTLGEPIPVRIDELFVRDSAFLQVRQREKNEKVRLALIYEDQQKRVRLKVREVAYQPGLGGDVGTADVKPSDDPEDQLKEDLELGSSHIVPVPSPTYGMLILGETSITYYEHSSKTYMRRPMKAATIFCAWAMIDRQRYVLADEYGKLYMLMLSLDEQQRVTDWVVEDFGVTTRASVLVYMDAGKLFVGSHSGDSQLIRIGKATTETIQTLPNIAPILDFTIMDMGSRSGGEATSNEYSSGQARLVTGSGAFSDGSLRSVRSGVGLEDLGMLAQMENISSIFSVSSRSSGDVVDTMVVSLIDETRVFRFTADGNVEEVDQFCGMTLTEPTLLVANVASHRILQVTPKAARLLEIDSGMTVAEWAAPAGKSITAAAANESSAVLSIGGESLIALDTTSDLRIKSEKTFGADQQIACVSLTSAFSSVCLVGFWQGSAISILSLDTLETIQTETVEDNAVSVPRTILLLNVLEDQPPTLFVAMADGNIVTYSVDTKTYALSSRRSTVLGTQQAGFTALPKGDGLYNVFATCDHSSLIYGSEGRLVFSAITAEDATCVCSFNAEAFPGAIAIATKDHLKLAVVDEERSTHVQGLPMGATVRRIAYSPELKAFGLGTITRDLEEGAEIVKSRFQLVDEVVFKVLHTFELNTEELVESVMRCQLDDGYGNLAERFVVGTAYLDDEQADAVRGRILVFEVTTDRQLKKLTELEVKGACRCLSMVDGKIVAALIKTVCHHSFPCLTLLTCCRSSSTLSNTKPQAVPSFAN